jgi:TatD DNase family protein
VLIDSHCHIPMIAADAALVVNSARAQGVAHMLCVSVDLESLPQVLATADRFDCVSASVGVHPNAVLDAEPAAEQLAQLAVHPKVVAIGETGLDYFRSRGDLEWQRERFRTHIRAAKLCAKPLIIHSREARGDVIGVLEEEGADAVGGIMHCFVDDLETAQRAIALNFLISFSGIVTFRNAKPLQEVARALPLDRILVETDSPYLAPEPVRGKENQPANVRHVAECIAGLRGIPFEAVAAATTENFLRLFPDVLI